MLLPGTEVTLTVEKTGRAHRWRYDGGLQQYLLATLGTETLLPPFEAEGYAGADDETFAEGEGARWVLVWSEDGTPVRESYVNLIPTTAAARTRPACARACSTRCAASSMRIRCCPRA